MRLVADNIRLAVAAFGGFLLFLGFVLALGAGDGARLGKIVELLWIQLSGGWFFVEVVVSLLSIVLTFVIALAVSYACTLWSLSRHAIKVFAVLLKVTPALALTPILMRRMPHGWSDDLQNYGAVVATAVIIGFYPIFSQAVHEYEAGKAGAAGRFTTLVGSGSFRAHRIVWWSFLVRGAAVGSIAGFPLVIIGAIVGEMIVAADTPTIGYQIMVGLSGADSSAPIAAVLVSTILGLLAYVASWGLREFLQHRGYL